MKKKVILIVDDEQTYLETITDLLDKMNFEIIQALNGAMGIMVANQFNPDIKFYRLGNAYNEWLEMTTRLKIKPETGQVSFNPAIMKLADIIQRNLAFLEPSANLKNITISFNR